MLLLNKDRYQHTFILHLKFKENGKIKIAPKMEGPNKFRNGQEIGKLFDCSY